VIKFRRAERPGAYCRVIKAGHVKVNDPVVLLPFAGEQVGIVETFRAFYRKQLSAETLEHFLAAPIHYKERAYYQAMLENLRLA
jgi:MOSC domain-containing protein YiiM